MKVAKCMFERGMPIMNNRHRFFTIMFWADTFLSFQRFDELPSEVRMIINRICAHLNGNGLKVILESNVLY